MTAMRPSSADDRSGHIATVFHAVTIGATLIGGAFAIEAASLPFIGLDRAVLVLLGALLVGLTYCVSAVLIGLSGQRYRRMLVAPVIAVALVALAVSGLPKVVRVAISDAALSETNHAIETGALQLPEYDDEPILWAGVMPIYGVWGGDTYLVTGFTGSDTPAGLVRLRLGPPGEDIANSGRRYQHVYGAWYRWWYD